MATDSVLTHETEQEIWSGGKEPFKASYGKLMMWYFLVSDAFTFAGFLIAYGALRFSVPTWPLPDFVFSSLPFGIHHAPLIFVTIMTFVLILSSVTMVRAVQEGHHGNKNGVVFWMLMTIFGGLAFLGCQAWEWSTLIGVEHMTVTTNPFGAHTKDGVYLENEYGHPYAPGEKAETFTAGHTYLIEKAENPETGKLDWVQRKMKHTDGTESVQQFGPKAFGALFFFITGFHGFHVLSGVVFLLIIMVNVASGLYHNRGNHYEMVEKIGLYWHFVDLVWVFVFLVFYLL
ncbi:MAG: cytochrome c oxidase subunit 3 [Saprospiraceae bacterium]|nr:cytochrome c oxidase subunit 3 [Saprospiraceae bacterium]